MESLFGIRTWLPYTYRLQQLMDHRVALWDVLDMCFRPGSLDTAIAPESIVVNDFNTFLAERPGIRLIGFNGGKAAALFKRHVLPTLDASRAIEQVLLPSTSPAFAGMSQTAKIEQWRTALTQR